MKKDSLAFQIVSDLLFAKIICEDVSPTEIQFLVQARLDLDPRFREKIVHFQDGTNVSKPVCHQIGGLLQITHETSKVTCLRCIKYMAPTRGGKRPASGEHCPTFRSGDG